MRTRLTALLGVLLVGTLPAVEQPAPEKPTTAAEYLRAPTVALLKEVTRVEVFRINPERSPEFPVETQIGGFPVTATGKEQGKEFATNLANLLLTDGTWTNPKAAKCFDPGVAYRLWKDKSHVDVLICFNCHNLQVTSYDAEGKKLVEAFGNMEDASYAGLLKLTKAAFPDDKQIQDLGGK
jgi:hypothetical protein